MLLSMCLEKTRDMKADYAAIVHHSKEADPLKSRAKVNESFFKFSKTVTPKKSNLSR